MRFHSPLHKEMLRTTILEEDTGIEPAVLTDTCIEQIIGVEDASVERFASVLLYFVIWFEVLNGVVEIDTKVQACCEVAQDKFGLDTYAYAETVGEA